MITWQDKIPFRNGRALCSQRDPIAEAKAWVVRTSLDASKNVLVIGQGAGLHVEALRRQHPQKSILSMDLNIELSPDIFVPESVSAEEIWASVLETRVNENFQVVHFRPSWSGNERHFQRIHELVLGRTRELLPWMAADPGLIQWSERVDSSLYLGVKPLVFSQQAGENLSEKQKILLALRELII